jgi:hypothetical protein
MGEQNQQRDYGLSCLTWWDKETNVYISHCLNYDLMETGGTREESRKNLKMVMKHHIEHCYSRYPQGLKRSAPPEQWQEFFLSLQKNPQGVVMDQLDIDPLPPLPEHSIPIWIQGVDSSGDLPVF